MIPTLDDLLVFASELTDEGGRASALTDLAPRIPADRLDAVLDVAFTEEHHRSRVMRAVLARATPAQITRVKTMVRQFTELWPQYDLLVALLPHLDDDERAVVLEKLITTLERLAPTHLPAVGAELVPLLRPDQLDRLVTVGLRGPDRAAFLAGVWDDLPDSMLDELVSKVGADLAEYDWILERLAQRLNGEQLARLLAAAYALDGSGVRGRTLAILARHIPEPARSAAIEASVAAAVAEVAARPDRWDWAHAKDLLPHANHQQLDALLAADHAGRRAGMNPGLAAIAPFAAPAQLAAAIAARIAPTRLGDPLPETADTVYTVSDLVMVIAHVPTDLRDAVVRTILPRFDPWMYRISHLSADQAVGLLDRVTVPTEPWKLARSIGGLAPFLDAAGLDQAMAAVLAIEDEDFRAEALRNIAPFLGPAHLVDAAGAASGIRDAAVRAYTLLRLAPHVGQPDITQSALSAAMAVPDPTTRARQLLQVAAVLPESERGPVLGSAWAALATMPPGFDQGSILSNLINLMPTG